MGHGIFYAIYIICWLIASAIIMLINNKEIDVNKIELKYWCGCLITGLFWPIYALLLLIGVWDWLISVLDEFIIWVVDQIEKYKL